MVAVNLSYDVCFLTACKTCCKNSFWPLSTFNTFSALQNVDKNEVLTCLS